MAVPAGQRSENKLEVLERAQRFAIHLIEVTANTKNFPGRFAPIVTRICDTAWEIAENIYTANKVYIGETLKRIKWRHTTRAFGGLNETKA